jgi:predicted HicB family RNase H-like nuclease
MTNLLEYKNYYGSVEFSMKNAIFCGEIEFINDLVTFEAYNVKDLKKAFHEAVDHYIETCKKLGRDPQKAFKGQFNVRVEPELHRKAALTALRNKISLNSLVKTAIGHEIERLTSCNC